MFSRAITGLLLATLITACDAPVRQEIELTGPVMGTLFSIKLVDPPTNLDQETLAATITERLEDIEQRFSTYRPSSELSVVNRTLTTDWIPVSAELCQLVESSIGYSRRTNGAFDITVGPLILLWGFGPDGNRGTPPRADLLTEARSSVGYEKLTTDCSVPAIRKALPGVNLDLSALAKGFAVDEVSAMLEDQSLTDFLVEIGGELCARGLNARSAPWAIAIEKPAGSSRTVQTVIDVTNRCMATSGDYRNFFTYEGMRYSHTVDPATGRPVTHSTASVTVLAETSAEADAMATALLVRGADDGLAFAEIVGVDAYFLVRNDGDFEEVRSSSFEGRAQ